MKASGLRRSHIVFVFMTRLFKRSQVVGKKTVVAMLFCILSGLVSLSFSSENRFLRSVNSLLMDLSAMLVHYINEPLMMIKDSTAYFQRQKTLQEEIKTLKETDLRLIEWKNRALFYERENQHLRELSHFLPSDKGNFTTVKVLGMPLDGVRSTMIVAQPKDSPLMKNQAVTSPQGVVGRIVDVGQATARVMLITDINSRIPVRIESTGTQAIVAGSNTGELSLAHIEQPENADKLSISAGDRLLTSGYGGIFPPGLPVAIVSRIDNFAVFATPISETLTLEYVAVHS